MSIRIKPTKRSLTNSNVTARIRFRIFNRDKFTCQYCGRKATKTRLQIDHINPVSNGGITDPSNLITSCFDCNIGKSSMVGIHKSEYIEEICKTPLHVKRKIKVDLTYNHRAMHFQLYPGIILEMANEMSLEELGAYIIILSSAWQANGLMTEHHRLDNIRSGLSKFGHLLDDFFPIALDGKRREKMQELERKRIRWPVSRY